MDDPYKLPRPTIPYKTMVVHGTPRSAGACSFMQMCSLSPKDATILQQRWQRQQLGGSVAAAEAEARQRQRR